MLPNKLFFHYIDMFNEYHAKDEHGAKLYGGDSDEVMCWLESNGYKQVGESIIWSKE